MGICLSCCSKNPDRCALSSRYRSRGRGSTLSRGAGSQSSVASDNIVEGAPTEVEAEMSPVTDLLPTHHTSDNMAGRVPNEGEAEMSALTNLPQEYNQLVRIVYAPASDHHQCAYCNDPSGDFYDYFHVFDPLPCDLFEEFIDNGWWRTGKVVFRPRFDVVCCPGYSLRLPVREYVLTKKHRKVIRKWGEFLRNGDPQWENREAGDSNMCAVQPSGEKELGHQQARRKKRGSVTPGTGPDPSKPPCKKAKERRAERLKAKGNLHSPHSHEPSDKPPNQASLVDYIAQHIPVTPSGTKHTLDVKLVSCNPMDPLLRATIPQAYKLYDKLQRFVHPGKVRFDSEDQFIQGFCNSCLSPQVLQGTYHIQYYLDHELAMYSIVDITQQYLISIYFVYDPDLRFLSPGIFTCLYEMNMVLKLKQTLPNMKYYGLGYYNHFDDKASYKRQFKPQQVLCNETNRFVSLESAIPKFLEKKYCRLVDESVPEKDGRKAAIDMLVVSKRFFRLGRFISLPRQEKERYQSSLKQFITEAGSSAAHKCEVDLMSNFEN